MILKGKVCLVTGGTRGIGAAAALALAQDGADVAITGRRDDEVARATKRAIEALGVRCELVKADCATTAGNTECAEAARRQLGEIDVLVHSAGGPANGGLLEVKPEEWHRAFDTHVHAVFHLCRAVIPDMRRKREGAIVLISSTAGIRALHSNIAYQVVKGALPQFTRALAREFANDNIRVNCVAPGVIRTDFHANMSEQQKKLNLEQRIPLHREGTPEQVGTFIRELIRNDYVTGETVAIDGGLTMRIA